MNVSENSSIASEPRKTITHTLLNPALPLNATLSIVIPAYNEARTISLVLNKILEIELILGIKKEVIVVNDCSTDETDLIIRDFLLHHSDLNIQYFLHDANTGKGGAIHTGIRHATGEFLLVQDADLEYDPADYNTLLMPMVKGHADVVYGSRFMGGSPHRILFFWHTVGNRFLTFLSNAFSNLNLTDMETGYKLFRTAQIRQIPLKEARFGFEPEITAKIARMAGTRIYEVGISYYGRSYKEGKKIKWRDGIHTVVCIFKYSVLFHKQLIVAKPETATPVSA